MDCRTFHRRLEDYLEGGLDFPARFGMERHAKQCYACEKDVTEAVRLRQMARELQRVGAPPNFETALLARIQTEKSHRRFWKLQSLWLYGFEGFSWRAASITALVTVSVVVTVSYFHFGTGRYQPTAPQVAEERLAAQLPARNGSDAAPNVGLPDESALSGEGDVFARGTKGPVGLGRDDLATPFATPADSDYVEFLVPVSGDRQLIMRLPRTIRMQYNQPSREYFIRNVSH